MPIAKAKVVTEHASRYLQQLCKHWGHKYGVTFDPAQGTIVFDETSSCELKADPTTLFLTVHHSDADKIERLAEVVAVHITRFAFREELDIHWRNEI
ncbi:DUF2218 domain-containing protein [Pararhizobium sp.]|uniref:DUF2218 domain-containing protein n=1 Tax=Pararhizobium sp. TaxID=1977563 RepID=UPI00272618DA|nr:DUF2218 domain-containing protein [Pararhizobium sp.]MDO9416811.1 DUF2218 domain-containing protein [Pararhizobium sp.]